MHVFSLKVFCVPVSMRDEMLNFAKQLKAFMLGPFNPSVNVLHWLETVLYKHLPPNAHHLANGRLAVAMTRIDDGKLVIKSEFESKEDVVQVNGVKSVMCGVGHGWWGSAGVLLGAPEKQQKYSYSLELCLDV